MISLGLDNDQKRELVERYCTQHGVSKVFVLSPKASTFEGPGEVIEYADIIEYRFYYRLIQEIDPKTLIVVNECLRTQNRFELTYNCIRNFLNQTQHRIILQRYPLIDSFEDFMILFDFDTRSRWKPGQWRPEFLQEIELSVVEHPVALNRIEVPTSAKVQEAYQKEKRKLIDGIGAKDPHTIPRNLHLFAGKAKLGVVDPHLRYVGRNNRFKLRNLDVYSEAQGPGDRIAFEFCHRFLDFTDFLAQTQTTNLDALVSDLKVDSWYFERFTSWTERLKEAYASLRPQQSL